MKTPDYPLVWWWRARLGERKGQRCRITARGALNSVRVEFPDGFWCITSRWAARPAGPEQNPGAVTAVNLSLFEEGGADG